MDWISYGCCVRVWAVCTVPRRSLLNPLTTAMTIWDILKSLNREITTAVSPYKELVERNRVVGNGQRSTLLFVPTMTTLSVLKALEGLKDDSIESCRALCELLDAESKLLAKDIECRCVQTPLIHDIIHNTFNGANNL